MIKKREHIDCMEWLSSGYESELYNWLSSLEENNCFYALENICNYAKQYSLDSSIPIITKNAFVVHADDQVFVMIEHSKVDVINVLKELKMKWDRLDIEYLDSDCLNMISFRPNEGFRVLKSGKMI